MLVVTLPVRAAAIVVDAAAASTPPPSFDPPPLEPPELPEDVLDPPEPLEAPELLVPLELPEDEPEPGDDELLHANSREAESDATAREAKTRTTGELDFMGAAT
jgi:hypothetical protein